MVELCIKIEPFTSFLEETPMLGERLTLGKRQKIKMAAKHGAKKTGKTLSNSGVKLGMSAVKAFKNGGRLLTDSAKLGLGCITCNPYTCAQGFESDSPRGTVPSSVGGDVVDLVGSGVDVGLKTGEFAAKVGCSP